MGIGTKKKGAGSRETGRVRGVEVSFTASLLSVLSSDDEDSLQILKMRIIAKF